MAKPGDRVKVVADKEEIEGILMPEEKEFVVVKLDTGYNMGIDKKRVKEIKPLGKKKEKKAEFPKEKPNPKLPTITILHTGGTIASKVDYETGGVIARFSPEEILAMFPELKDIAKDYKKIVVIEMNEGQYVKEVERMLKRDIQFINCNGGSLSLEEIKNGIQRLS